MDSGSYLRSDEMTLDRGRLDYACVLIATPLLEVASCVDKFLIDGQLVEVKIVEEWDFNLGEDACLFEEEEDQQSQSERVEVHGDPEAGENVDAFVEHFVKEIAEEDVFSENVAKEVDRTDDNSQTVTHAAESELGSQAQSDNVLDGVLMQSSPSGPVLTPVVKGAKVIATDVNELLDGDMPKGVDGSVLVSNVIDAKSKQAVAQEEGIGRASAVSEPLVAGKSVLSGPWSTKWLKDHHGGAGVIFATKRKIFKACKRKVKNRLEEGVDTKRRKIGGELRHTVLTLKKMARLSSKDRSAVLKTLEKKELVRGRCRLCLHPLVKKCPGVLLTKLYLRSLLIKIGIIGWFYMGKRRRLLRMCGVLGRL